MLESGRGVKDSERNTPPAHLMSLPFRPTGSRPKPTQNRGNFRRDPMDRGPKRNERIRATEVRVITAAGEMLGVMPVEKALNLAKEQGVDLIEIAGTAVPPVCKLIELGKFLYEESKKSKHQKHTAKMKELKFRPRFTDTKLSSFSNIATAISSTLKLVSRQLSASSLNSRMSARQTAYLSAQAVASSLA